jgi:hypothetical protein
MDFQLGMNGKHLKDMMPNCSLLNEPTNFYDSEIKKNIISFFDPIVLPLKWEQSFYPNKIAQGELILLGLHGYK